MNDVTEEVLSIGTAVNSETSSSDGFFHGTSVYFNRDTKELWKCVGVNAWQSEGFLKGDKGADGISPVASVIKSGNKTTISITDETGTTTEEVLDGKDGKDGIDGMTPTASVTKTGNVATITITDASGTTSETITDGNDGKDGKDGISPTASITKTGNVATITITDSSGTTSETLTDGKDGTNGKDGVSITASSQKSGKITTVTITDKNTGTIIDSFQIQDGADGTGGGGDMMKSTYDADNDGIVDSAEALSDGSVRMTPATIQQALEGKASSAQGEKADTAVQSVKIGETEYKNGTSVVLPAYPTTLPASDVPAWAKAASKPAYTASEVGALASTVTHLSGDVPTSRKVNNKALSSDITLTAADVGALATGDIADWAKASTKPTYTKSEVGLGNVGNFKAVSTVASQGLTDTEKSNARANIGAGTYSKPSTGIPKTDLASGVIPTVTDTYSSTSSNAMSGKAVASAVSNKADKSTTLSGYGITNAYTKTEVDNKVDSTANTSTVASDGTVTFQNVDVNKTYELYVDVDTSTLASGASPVGIETITLTGTGTSGTLKYKLTNAKVGADCKLREIKL